MERCKRRNYIPSLVHLVTSLSFRFGSESGIRVRCGCFQGTRPFVVLLPTCAFGTALSSLPVDLQLEVQWFVFSCCAEQRERERKHPESHVFKMTHRASFLYHVRKLTRKECVGISSSQPAVLIASMWQLDFSFDKLV